MPSRAKGVKPSNDYQFRESACQGSSVKPPLNPPAGRRTLRPVLVERKGQQDPHPQDLSLTKKMTGSTKDEVVLTRHQIGLAGSP